MHREWGLEQDVKTLSRVIIYVLAKLIKKAAACILVIRLHMKCFTEHNSDAYSKIIL